MIGQPSRVTDAFGIKYPIIQAGMVWVSGAKLASASANAGCLGVLGAGSLTGDLLCQHIQKAQKLSDKPIAVNFPIMYPGTEERVETALAQGIQIFIMSAGSPKIYTRRLQDQGAKVWHVTSSPVLAKKCEDAGVDGVIVEGFEAGGHNGRDELTTFVLIPQVKKAVRCPVVAAGGIATGAQMLAAMALGADGVQIGSRFAATHESSAHQNFKQAIVDATPSDTHLMLKKLAPVRLLKNAFYEKVKQHEEAGSSKKELTQLLGKGRAKIGMLLGDLDEGELEIGQISGLIDDILTVDSLVSSIIKEFRSAQQALTSLSLEATSSS